MFNDDYDEYLESLRAYHEEKRFLKCHPNN